MNGNAEKDHQKSLSTKTLSKRSLPKEFYSEIKKIFEINLYSDSAKEEEDIISVALCYLCDHFEIPRCGVKIFNKRRPWRAKYWLRGQYIQNDRGKCMVYIWKYSETNRKLCAAHIIHLILHEFIHHYDFKKLQINLKKHDSGFWHRLKRLRKMTFSKKLLPK